MLIMIPKFLWIPLLIILVIISNINWVLYSARKNKVNKKILTLFFLAELKTKISPFFIFEVL